MNPIPLPPIYKTFKPGTEPYQVYLRVRQQPKTSNDEIFSEMFYPKIIQDFLAGQSHTTLIVGNRNSGKSYTAIGSIRDPGIILLALQEIFEQIEDKFLEDNVTLKLSVIQHQKNGFRDLLVDPSWESLPYPCFQDQALLGIPEIIVDNFLLAMKIIRIALVNLQNLEQSIETESFNEKLRNTTLIVEIKAEIAPTSDIREQVIVSKLRFVKTLSEQIEIQDNRSNNKKEQTFLSCLTGLFKILSDMSQKNRRTQVLNYRTHPIIEYLRETLTTTSKVTIIGCCNVQDQPDINRIINYGKQILSSAQMYQFSIQQWNTQLRELIENERDGMGLFCKEFAISEPSKFDRGKTIFKILMEILNLLTQYIDTLESKSELTYQLNCIYSQILTHHCMKYTNIITTEDIKEFFIAKVELYAIEQIQSMYDQISPILKNIIQDLYSKHRLLIQLKQQINTFFNKINQTNYSKLFPYDFQRFTNINRLALKLLHIFNQTQKHNIFNSREARTALIYIFQEVNQVSEVYLEELTKEQLQTDEDQKNQQSSIIEKITEYIVPEELSQQEKELLSKKQEIISVKDNNKKRNIYQSESDIIQQLFFDKMTREYINYQNVIKLIIYFKIIQQIFPTQLPNTQRDINKSQLETYLLKDNQTNYNFFNELQKKQKRFTTSTSDFKINPNQIKQMVIEWQGMRNHNKTGINFLRSTYERVKDSRQMTMRYNIKQRKSQSLSKYANTEMVEFKQEIVNINDSPLMGNLSGQNQLGNVTKLKLPKLNPKDSQYGRFYIQ